MNLKKLFEMQRALDRHIEEKHQLLEEDLFNRKVLALMVELGELANETRCFKFWSIKPASTKNVILEEFVDGVHFILSLGIECGYTKIDLQVPDTAAGLDATEQFLRVYEKTGIFQTSKRLEDYVKMFESYLQLAAVLGITYEEMEQAYFAKNEVNYQRQQNNY
ncbi:dUTP diphosphatase [Bacillus sp. BRMEA1]|uniref:dUTP diphosphatase n=1 Tax=Neobacillus endophyticus TaxID=2738405 RepID=UPI001564A268|nr:dUTP diphosphatase [Neobacillus endophyticus]NRD76066.1 dUTP diphosphatase [Neobacillus endophyticus]